MPVDDQVQSHYPCLIVGLGNPGLSYEKTRHNAGVIVLEEIHYRLQTSFQNHLYCNAKISKNMWKDRPFIQVFPQTYMNCSGESVAKICKNLEISSEQILVCHDCLDLEEGRIKLKFGGSSGGHRGIESLIQELGTDQFSRLRLGIGRPPQGVCVADFVLTPWNDSELTQQLPMFQRGASAVLDAVEYGVIKAMNLWNNRDIQMK